MSVSVDCPACGGRLLIPEPLWQQKFAERSQRMRCKKCHEVVTIDGHAARSGSAAGGDTGSAAGGDTGSEAPATERQPPQFSLLPADALAAAQAPELLAPPVTPLVEGPARRPSHAFPLPAAPTPPRFSAPPLQASARGSVSPKRASRIPSLAGSGARAQAAARLEAAVPDPLLPDRDELPRPLIESSVSRIALPDALSWSQADSTPASRISDIPACRDERAARSAERWLEAITPAATPLPAPPLPATPLREASPRSAPGAPPAPARDSAPASSLQQAWPGALRTRAVALMGLASVLLGVLWGLLSRDSQERAPSTQPRPDTVAPSLATSPPERIPPPPPLLGSTLEAAPDDQGPVAEAETTPLPDDAEPAAPVEIRAPAPQRGGAVRRHVKKEKDVPAAAPPFDKATLKRALQAAVQKAEQCDLWGRPTGSAQLFVTFDPSGHVSEAHLEGEPIASAAVARCILHHARASSLPAFAGSPITVSRTITLR